MKLTVERTVIAGLCAMLVLTAVIGWVSYSSTTRLVRNADRVAGTLAARDKALDLLIGMDDLETGTRGYLVTGESPYLEPYRAAVAAAGERLSQLSQLSDLSGAGPEQQRMLADLRPLVAAELEESKRVVELRQSQGFEAASRAVRAGKGKALMDAIRKSVAAIVQSDDDRIARQADASRQQARRTVWALAVGSLLGVVFVAVASLFVHHDLGRWRRAEDRLRESEQWRRLLMESAKEYAIFMLDEQGRVRTWNPGAQRIKGYAAEEIVGQHFSRFYPPEDLAGGKPQNELRIAAETGKYEEDGWRLRKDGSRFWANVLITAMRDDRGNLVGFSKITRDLTDRKRAEDAITELNQALLRKNAQLESANKELEAFSYSVSHDLRAPLRGMDGFSQALLEDYADRLDDEGRDNLRRIRAASQKMGQLIDDLLNLSRVARADLRRGRVDLSAMAAEVAAELRAAAPQRSAEFVIEPGLAAQGDPRLLRVVLNNLLGNAWKFTSRRDDARIEFGRAAGDGADASGAEGDGADGAFFVRDNGVGFDMTYAGKLFGAFQRLHAMTEFPGTGIGLATVQRVIHRHGGRVRAEGAPGRGATFHFTL